MKNYRIVKITDVDGRYYYIQKKILFFWAYITTCLIPELGETRVFFNTEAGAENYLRAILSKKGIKPTVEYIYLTNK